MKFLIDADSPHSLIEIFKKHSHAAVHIRDVLGSATDDEIVDIILRNIKILHIISVMCSRILGGTSTN